MDVDVYTLNLNAYVIGLGEASFPVHPKSYSQIGLLKVDILPKIPRIPPGLVAAELTLYKVALTARDDDLKTLSLEGYKDKRKLDAKELLSEIFPKQPSLKDVSILVELPPICESVRCLRQGKLLICDPSPPLLIFIDLHALPDNIRIFLPIKPSPHIILMQCAFQLPITSDLLSAP
jgi:hypothetical protein